MSIDLAAAAEEEVRGFIAEESKCCPFFAFQLDRTARGVRLTVQTPPGGETMLGALDAAFDPAGPPVRARSDATGGPSSRRREAG